MLENKVFLINPFGRKMNNSTDAEIMQQVKSGDCQKLGILFERFKDQLFSYFYRQTYCSSSSEDMVQNVFLRILKYRQNFGYGTFKAWMYQIAHNVYADYYKKNNRYKTMSEINDLHLVENYTPEQKIDQQEKLQLLERAMQLLSDEQKQILILAKYQELKYKEIAEILNCSESNVKIRVFRALVQLKENYFKLEA